MAATAVPPQSSAPAGGLRGPFRLSAGLVALTVVVVLMGAMTTSTGSGLAYPDWPLSHGQWMPEEALTTPDGFLEHFHRIPAGMAVLLSLLLWGWLLHRRDVPRAARFAAAAGAALILAQALIGGLHVLEGLPLASAAVHGTLAQIVLALFGFTAYALSARWRATEAAPHPAAAGVHRITLVALAALIVQTVFGALARHSTGHSQHALWFHVGFAFVVFLLGLVAAGASAGRLGHVPGVRGLGRALVVLLVVQVSLGFVALLVRRGKDPENIEHLWQASLITVHVLTGALLTVTATLLAAHVRRGATRLPEGGGG